MPLWEPLGVGAFILSQSQGLGQSSGRGPAALQGADFVPPATVMRLLIVATPTPAVRSSQALVEPWGSLEVALRWLYPGFKVALGCLSPGY